MNTAFFNVADFFKIGLMSVLFLALVQFVRAKIKPVSAE